MKKTMQKNTSINKKAAGLVQATIISLIILVFGAAIILIFLHYFPFTQIVDKEACHNSVILRSQKLGEMLVVPLKCKTQYITIRTSDEEKIKRIIADAMYDCWWMLGEGRYKLFPESLWHEIGYGITTSPCIICSVIKFENNAKNKQINIVEYLNKTEVPGKNITYLQYFLDNPNTYLPTKLNALPIDTNVDYAIIFMGIKGQRIIESLKNEISLILGIGAVANVGSLAIGGIKGAQTLWTAAGKMLKVAAKNPKITAILLGLLGVGMVTTQIRRGYVAVNRCGIREGCYALILAPFDAGNITEYCTSIESIP